MKFVGFVLRKSALYDSHFFKIYELNTTGHMISDISCEYARSLCVAHIKRVSPPFDIARSLARSLFFRVCVCVCACMWFDECTLHSDTSSLVIRIRTGLHRECLPIFQSNSFAALFSQCVQVCVRISMLVDHIIAILFFCLFPTNVCFGGEQVNINWIKWACLRMMIRVQKSNQQPYKDFFFSCKTNF